MKEKLLELANTCLENSEFYSCHTENSPEHIAFYNYNYHYIAEFCHKKKTVLIDSQDCKISYSQKEKILKKINLEYDYYSNNNYFKFEIGRLFFYFDKKPPLSFCINAVVKNTTESIIDLKESKFNIIKNFLFGLKKRQYTKTITEYDLVVKAEHGLIKTEISIEEFLALVNKYKKNKERMDAKIEETQLQLCVDQVNDRIKKYKIIP